MVFSSLEFAEYPRAEIRALIDGFRQSTDSAMPATAVDEIVDIALHAAQSARSAMFRVLDSASQPAITVTAVGIATSLLKSDLEKIADGIAAYATQSGASLHRASVHVGGQAHG